LFIEYYYSGIITSTSKGFLQSQAGRRDRGDISFSPAAHFSEYAKALRFLYQLIGV
jgi:hypothetical protein